MGVEEEEEAELILMLSSLGSEMLFERGGGVIEESFRILVECIDAIFFHGVRVVVPVHFETSTISGGKRFDGGCLLADHLRKHRHLRLHCSDGGGNAIHARIVHDDRRGRARSGDNIGEGALIHSIQRSLLIERY